MGSLPKIMGSWTHFLKVMETPGIFFGNHGTEVSASARPPWPKDATKRHTRFLVGCAGPSTSGHFGARERRIDPEPSLLQEP